MYIVRLLVCAARGGRCVIRTFLRKLSCGEGCCRTVLCQEDIAGQCPGRLETYRHVSRYASAIVADGQRPYVPGCGLRFGAFFESGKRSWNAGCWPGIL